MMKNYEIVKLDPVNNYFIFDPQEAEKLKKKLRQNPKQLETLELFVEDMFSAELESVTSKKRKAPSNNPHDYVSLATYWWPNKDTPDGLPYVQKDGYANPEGEDFDKDKFRRVAYITYHGALLYYITGKEKYYTLIEKHLRNWFIDDSTKMNPHMNYGQFIPGIVEGRREGIIDYTANFMYALRMLHLLRQQGMLQDNLYLALKDWHIQFKQWLLISDIGKGESNSPNNHGTMYYLGLIIISEFIQDTKDIPEFIEKSNEKMLAQIDAEYTLPLETARTKSLNYTLMCFKGLMDTLRLSEAYKMTLDKAVLHKIADWMKPYYTCEKPWPHTQVTPYDKGLNIYFAYLYNYVFKENLSCNIQEEEVINRVTLYLFS